MENVTNAITSYHDESGKVYWRHLLAEFRQDLQNRPQRFDKRKHTGIRGGRPYTYSPREIGEKMLEYFEECIEKNIPLTVTGMCMHIRISRHGLLNLEKSLEEEFIHTIKKGKGLIEIYLETQLYLSYNPKGIIFILKGMGWGNEDRAKRTCRPVYALSEIEKNEVRERMRNFAE